MTAFTAADKLHRLVKQALDSGAAASIAEAEALFAGYRLALRIGEEAARDRHHQAALLTAVALARRVFLGGVSVAPLPDAPLAVPLPFGATLAEAIVGLGASISEPAAGTPVIEIGGAPSARRASFHVRAVFAGWRGGIVPAPAKAAPVPAPVMALAPMLAAAFAVNEAFLYVSGHVGVAGRRAVGLSLWDPAPACDWLGATVTEPVLSLLPARLWLIGLGHLGQAYLWALGLLPFARPQDLSLILQDIDIITPSTESTSILSDFTLINVKKTRAMAAWAERRGFSTVIHERLFDASFRRQDDEPAVALCGLDNGAGRQSIKSASTSWWRRGSAAGTGTFGRSACIRFRHRGRRRRSGAACRRTIRSRTAPHTRACSRVERSIAVASRCSPAGPSARRSSAP
jgi:hypothetical protein